MHLTSIYFYFLKVYDNQILELLKKKERKENYVFWFKLGSWIWSFENFYSNLFSFFLCNLNKILKLLLYLHMSWFLCFKKSLQDPYSILINGYKIIFIKLFQNLNIEKANKTLVWKMKNIFFFLNQGFFYDPKKKIKQFDLFAYF